MKGIIVKGVGGLYYVKSGNELIKCKARGKFRFNELTPMVGDIVEVSINKGEGVIENINQRSNELVRPFVANVTQAFVVVTFKNPDLNLNLLNSFLLLCQSKGLKILVCFNKIDLVNLEEEKISNIIKTLKEAGYQVALLNAKEGEGIEFLKEKLKDEVTVFCGPSGVGKSTILNKIFGREVMQTGDISQKSKRGKHTTRHSELIEIDGGFVVDTPGFSSLDISFITKEELKYCFPEFEKYNCECKFSNCLHYKEPGCKVKEAVEQGEISKERYEFYIKTIEEITHQRRN
ncbi:ribosome small subunit-dependent GTPase A [Haloimpatiens lingqiaonensis]|uniref:ribosome small subunit-dependent GTPase A n=1 Tax=Haloimpatiens lingqiaonensis TaxID=1380675 RepID=UPI0010FD2974|nr:ribosome small subunit-dependent GTPase A [Haloimpatiens lingqiaonensis]